MIAQKSVNTPQRMSKMTDSMFKPFEKVSHSSSDEHLKASIPTLIVVHPAVIIV